MVKNKFGTLLNGLELNYQFYVLEYVLGDKVRELGRIEQKYEQRLGT
jgi:hypothetical protein